MRKVGITLASVAILGLGLPAVGPAHADVELMTCTGTNSTTFSPPLTNTTQTTDVSLEAKYGTPNGLCIDANNTITSGYFANNVTGPTSCNTLGLAASETRVISWNNGSAGTSTIDYTRQIVRGLATTQVILTGTVTDGVFDGATVVNTGTFANTDLLGCLTTGISSQEYLTTLTITST